MYAIKSGYIERSRPRYFHDIDRGICHQPDVLSFAAAEARNRGLTRLVDVGCGRAEKLAELSDFERVGVDYGPNLQWCREHHPWGDWVEIDLDGPHELPGGGLIVCADVIEHLRRPEFLLDAIAATDCPAVLSTPERDLTWGPEHSGPPPNLAHVREWSLGEFRSLLAERFSVSYIGLTRTDDIGTGDKTILAVVE